MKKRITSDSIIAVLGIGLSLLSMVVVFSKDTPLSFLITAIVAPFGFVGFWILLPFLFILGLYMLLKQKLVKFRVGLSLWGLLIIILSMLVLTSSWAEQPLMIEFGLEEELSFGTISPMYTDALVGLNYDPYNTLCGGGFVGYFLCGCLYSAVTRIGTQIICWVLIFIGLLLVFNRQIKKLFLLIKGRKSKAKQERAYAQSDIVTEEINPTPMVNTVQEQKETIDFAPSEEKSLEEVPYTPSHYEINDENDLLIRNVNNNHGLKRADFFAKDDDSLSFDDDNEQSFVPIEDAIPTSESPSFFQANEPVLEEARIENEISQDSFPQEESFSLPKIEEPKMMPDFIEEKEPEVEVDKSHRPQPRASLIRNYIYPPIDLLDFHEASDDSEKNAQSTQETTDMINNIFEQLHIGAKVVGSTVGPSVTRYDVQTNSDVSVNSVNRYVEDISIRLGGVPIRFEKIVFGKATSGLEIPNAVRTNVGLRESIEKLPVGPKALRMIPFGKNISGELLFANLSDFPHMLVSGTTGSGKTIFMHSVILSLIMRNKPDELKIVLIDPKKVEMAFYEKIPHLLCPNISNSSKAYVAMKKLVEEMERRYNLFADNRVRDIKGFNEFAKANNIQPLPYIVVFIDEYADLVEEVKDIKTPVVRIAQKARAAGIHLVIATQRPSVNVIDGVIKANVAVRVALMVASQVDSISIINQAGAETLLGNGDMIVDCPLINRSVKPRVQGCFVDNHEIIRVCDFLRSHYQEQYDPDFLDLEEHNEPAISDDGASDIVVDKEMAEEALYELIKENIVDREYCSISYIQRTYAVGFPKAGRLFNKLINDGYVARGGDARGSKVLIRKSDLENKENETNIDGDNIC